MQLLAMIFTLGAFLLPTDAASCCGSATPWGCCTNKVTGVPAGGKVIYDPSCPSGGLGCNAGGVECCRFCFPDCTGRTGCYQCPGGKGTPAPTPKTTTKPTPKTTTKPTPKITTKPPATPPPTTSGGTCKPQFSASFNIDTGSDPVGCTNEAFRVSMTYALSAIYGVPPFSYTAWVPYAVQCQGLISVPGATVFNETAITTALNFPISKIMVTAECAIA